MRRAWFAPVMLVVLLLAGCSLLPFGDDDPKSGGSQGDGGSGGTGQEQPSTPGDGEGGDADDDAVSTGKGQLPASWPDSIPVPENGTIDSAIESPGSWVVSVQVPELLPAFDEVSGGLKANGYTATVETGGDVPIGLYDNGTYQVTLLADDTSGTPTLTYSVIEK